MTKFFTTYKFLFLFLLIGVFCIFGRGAPTAFATTDFVPTGTATYSGNVYSIFNTPTNTYGVYFGIYSSAGTALGAGWFKDTTNTIEPIGGTSIHIDTYYNSHSFWTSYTGSFVIFSCISHWSGTCYGGSETPGSSTYATMNAGGSYILKTIVNIVGGVPVFSGSAFCTDGIQNGSETGIDIGGSCEKVKINTPVDTTNVQDFQNFSVTYTGVDIPSQNHQVLVQWTDNSALLTTCENGVAGSLYTGTFVTSSSYTVCTNSLPRIYIDLNTISFSAGIHNYTGSVPKTHSLTNGTTYYAQAFIVADDGFYYVASPVISFTANNGVPIVTGNGTITNTAGSGTITGTGTHFTSTLHIGDTITVGGQQCSVQSIASDTELECTPLTSAHTGASYTQNSNFDSNVLQETCSTWDIGCYIKNTITWFFGVNDSTLQNFGTLKDSLFSRFPFSYISDVGVLFGETFNQSANSFSLDITLLGNNFTILSTAQLETIPFQSLVRTIMGAMAMFFTVMSIYRKIIRIHDANHQTA